MAEPHAREEFQFAVVVAFPMTGVASDQDQPIGLERLFDIVVGATADRRDGGVGPIAVGGLRALVRRTQIQQRDGDRGGRERVSGNGVRSRAPSSNTADDDFYW
mgnify:CR=1 FL=1